MRGARLRSQVWEGVKELVAPQLDSLREADGAGGVTDVVTGGVTADGAGGAGGAEAATAEATDSRGRAAAEARGAAAAAAGDGIAGDGASPGGATQDAEDADGSAEASAATGTATDIPAAARVEATAETRQQKLLRARPEAAVIQHFNDRAKVSLPFFQILHRPVSLWQLRKRGVGVGALLPWSLAEALAGVVLLWTLLSYRDALLHT